LSFGSGSLVIVVLTGSPDPRQHPLGSGHQPVSGQLSETAGGEADHHVPVSCRLSAHRHSLLGSSAARRGS